MISLIKKISSVLLAILLLSACQSNEPNPSEDEGLQSPPNEMEVSTSSLPSLPSVPNSTEQQINALIDAEVPEVIVPVDDAGDPPIVQPSPEFQAATSPQSVKDCEALADEALKAICYQAGAFGRNTPSVQADLEPVISAQPQ